eukprot:1161694-Pelagomonas_calceolata.AAC.11
MLWSRHSLTVIALDPLFLEEVHVLGWWALPCTLYLNVIAKPVRSLSGSYLDLTWTCVPVELLSPQLLVLPVSQSTPLKWS